MALGIFSGVSGLGGNISGLVQSSKLFKEKSKLLFIKTATEIEVKLAVGINNSCENLENKIINFSSKILTIKKDWLALSDLLRRF